MPVVASDDGPVRELRLSRPERLNALDDVLLGELAAELDRAARDGVRALLLRGEGSRAFSAGYDLNALPSVTEGPLPDALLETTLAKLDELPMPIVAFVNGHAFGGGLELAARCDVRIGVEGSKLGMPPAKLGIVYAPRGLARFWALMGPSGARKLFLSGEPIPAAQAHQEGLLDELHPDFEAAERAAQVLVRIMAANAPLAIAGTRRIFAQLEASLLSGVDAAEAERIRRHAFGSDDAREGRAAFLEKRTPRFTGK